MSPAECEVPQRAAIPIPLYMLENYVGAAYGKPRVA